MIRKVLRCVDRHYVNKLVKYATGVESATRSATRQVSLGQESRQIRAYIINTIVHVPPCELGAALCSKQALTAQVNKRSFTCVHSRQGSHVAHAAAGVCREAASVAPGRPAHRRLRAPPDGRRQLAAAAGRGAGRADGDGGHEQPARVCGGPRPPRPNRRAGDHFPAFEKKAVLQHGRSGQETCTDELVPARPHRDDEAAPARAETSVQAG